MSSAHGLVSPTTLVVDFSTQKLYWLDSAARKVGRVDFDGSDLETWTQSSFSATTSIAIYQVPYDHCTDELQTDAQAKCSIISIRFFINKSC